jgi:lysophospholipase L1-like esterase
VYTASMLKLLLITLVCLAQDISATSPVGRAHAQWAQRFEKIQSELTKSGNNANVLFIGDSITQGWENAGSLIWQEKIAPLGALNFGISGDRTEHVLWRLENSNFEGVSPDFSVVMIGTNNFGQSPPDSELEVLDGIIAVVVKLGELFPDTTIILLDIFPRGESFNQMRGSILQVNQILKTKYAEDEQVHFLQIGHLFTTSNGEISQLIMPDYLHLSEAGYQIWADAILPHLVEKKSNK